MNFHKPTLLFCCCSIFGIIFIGDLKSFITNLLSKIYLLLLIILSISSCVDECIHCFEYNNSIAESIPQLFSSMTLHLTNLYVTITFNFGKTTKHIEQLLQKIFSVEKIISIYKHHNEIYNSSFVKNIVLMLILNVSSTIADVAHTCYWNRSALIYIFLTNYYRFRLGVSLLLVSYTAGKIHSTLCDVNGILVIISDKENGLLTRKRKNLHFFSNMDLLQVFRDVAKIYTVLLKCVRIFNELYGWFLFLINIYAILSFIVTFNIIRMQIVFNMTVYTMMWCSIVIFLILVSIYFIKNKC